MGPYEDDNESEQYDLVLQVPLSFIPSRISCTSVEASGSTPRAEL